MNAFDKVRIKKQLTLKKSSLKAARSRGRHIACSTESELIEKRKKEEENVFLFFSFFLSRLLNVCMPQKIKEMHSKAIKRKSHS